MTKADFNNSVSSLDSKIAAMKTKNESIENGAILLAKVTLKKMVHKII